MYDYLDDRQTKRLKELVPYEVLAPDADEIIEELDRLNNIINKLEEYCWELKAMGCREGALDMLDKLKALKENNNE